MNPTTGKCVMHDEERLAAKRLLQQQGGRAHKTSSRLAAAAARREAGLGNNSLETYGGLTRLTAIVMARVYSGAMPPSIGDTIVKAVREQAKILRERDLVTSVAALRRELKEAKKASGTQRLKAVR